LALLFSQRNRRNLEKDWKESGKNLEKIRNFQKIEEERAGYKKIRKLTG